MFPDRFVGALATPGQRPQTAFGQIGPNTVEKGHDPQRRFSRAEVTALPVCASGAHCTRAICKPTKDTAQQGSQLGELTLGLKIIHGVMVVTGIQGGVVIVKAAHQEGLLHLDGMPSQRRVIDSGSKTECKTSSRSTGSTAKQQKQSRT
jgi:hypothetical protein